MARHALPDGWHLKDGFLADETGYERYVMSGGRLDTNRIALILENHGHAEHAKRWYLTPEQIYAESMFQALNEIVAEWDEYYGKMYYLDSAYRPDTGGITLARQCIEMINSARG